MSGSGKTTLGKEIARLMRIRAPNIVFIDGDEVREIFHNDNQNTDYSIEARKKNAERIVALCKMLDAQNIHVVCCILSIFEEMRVNNRNIFSSYFEIFMDAPIEVLKERDVKGHYALALAGKIRNFVGVDIEFPTPSTMDVTIDSTQDIKNITNVAKELITLAEKNEY